MNRGGLRHRSKNCKNKEKSSNCLNVLNINIRLKNMTSLENICTHQALKILRWRSSLVFIKENMVAPHFMEELTMLCDILAMVCTSSVSSTYFMMFHACFLTRLNNIYNNISLKLTNFFEMGCIRSIGTTKLSRPIFQYLLYIVFDNIHFWLLFYA